MPKKLPEIKIIRDTREKDNQGWLWEPEEKCAGKIQIVGTEEKGLDAADYTIEGYEDKIRIERKASMCELIGNMTPVSNKQRFEREMEKLRSIPYKYLVIESNLSKEVMGLSVQQFRHPLPMSVVFKWVMQLQMEYGIVPVFAGDAGKKAARYIFENFIRKIE